MVDRCLRCANLYNADNVHDIRSLLLRYFKWTDQGTCGKIKYRQFRRDLNTILRIAKSRETSFNSPPEVLYLNIHLSANRILNHIMSFYLYKRANHSGDKVVEEISEYQSYFDKYNFPTVASAPRRGVDSDMDGGIIKEQPIPEAITNDSESYGDNYEELDYSPNVPRIPLKSRNGPRSSTVEHSGTPDRSSPPMETTLNNDSPRRGSVDNDSVNNCSSSSSIGRQQQCRQQQHIQQSNADLQPYQSSDNSRPPVDQHDLNISNSNSYKVNRQRLIPQQQQESSSNDRNASSQLGQSPNDSSDYMDIENENPKDATSSDNNKQLSAVSKQSVIRKRLPPVEAVMRGEIPRKQPTFMKKEEESSAGGGGVKREPPWNNDSDGGERAGITQSSKFSFGLPPTSIQRQSKSDSPGPPTSFAAPKEHRRPRREVATYKNSKLHDVPISAPKTAMKPSVPYDIPSTKPSGGLPPAPPSPPLHDANSTPNSGTSQSGGGSSWSNKPSESNHGGWKPLDLCRSRSNDESECQDKVAALLAQELPSERMSRMSSWLSKMKVISREKNEQEHSMFFFDYIDLRELTVKDLRIKSGEDIRNERDIPLEIADMAEHSRILSRILHQVIVKQIRCDVDYFHDHYQDNYRRILTKLFKIWFPDIILESADRRQLVTMGRRPLVGWTINGSAIMFSKNRLALVKRMGVTFNDIVEKIVDSKFREPARILLINADDRSNVPKITFSVMDLIQEEDGDININFYKPEELSLHFDDIGPNSSNDNASFRCMWLLHHWWFDNNRNNGCSAPRGGSPIPTSSRAL